MSSTNPALEALKYHVSGAIGRGERQPILAHNVIAIWEDWHVERDGYFRAFWTDSPNGHIGCPVIGYCSPGGSHRTIKAAAAEARRLHPDAEIYRNGKLVKI